MDIDNDIENHLTTVEQNKQIPAVNPKLETNYNLTLREINRMFPDTENKLYNGFIRIQASSPENRISIIEYLQKNDKEFILSEASADRLLKAVIKGLPLNQNIEELKTILENRDFKIIRISRLKNYRFKTLHPYFLIEVAKTKNHLGIYNLKTIKLLSVTIKPYRKKNRATIFFKCSNFHHSARNCQFKDRCIKCEGNHETRDCTIKTKIDNPKCINCKENGHLASWRGCPMFPKLTFNISKPTYAQKLKNNIPKTPNPNINQTTSANAILNNDIHELRELVTALKIIKEAFNEFPNIIEISKKLAKSNNKQEKLNILLEIIQ
ncbi:hypothetical protein AVEN_188259-1 [Araneus ventricosus]|uniref:Pre-C2HC domain-containing protein n=1 Tax=Araneus ventricosus TaxID=182803 RepID=A0A4Y2HD45_ARAVE|nr:hypothetical protein AVEN_188259-1 [Araneus ventricosus]